MVDSVKFVAGGTVQAGGGVYIPREADRELLALCRNGFFAYVLTPRQMGKSSLMVQTAKVLKKQGIHIATVDLTTIGTQLNVEAWYLGLLTTICRQLGLLRQLMKWWQSHRHLGVTQRLTQFIEEVMLTEVSERIVIFIDEIDTTLNLDFTDDFFIAIRSFYLARAENQEFDRLSFVLFGVATPSDLIRNPQRTPFNIGQRVDLTDFTFEEALPLADGFGLPSEEAEQLLHWVLDWTGGHPYLTQRLCQTLRREERKKWSEVAVAEVMSQIFFGDASKQDTNLQFVRDMLTKRSPDIAAGLTVYREVLLNKQRVVDEEQSLVKSHLKLSGVVKRQSDGALKMRNRIYRQVFDLAWVREHLPINWLKLLRRAAVTSGIIFLVATAPLGIFAEMQRRVAVQRGNELEQRGIDLEIALADAEEARQEAEQARTDEEKQRKLAKKKQKQAEQAWQKAKIERERAKKAQQEAEKAQKREEKQRKKAVAARNAEAEQRKIAEQEKARAEQEKERAENLAIVAGLREQSTKVLNYLPTARATEGLVLAMHATIKSRELPSDMNPDLISDVQSTVDSSMLRASEEVKEQMVFRGHEGVVLSAAFSPDDKIIVSGGVDNTVRLWDLQGNQIGDPLEHESDVVSVAFSSDGQKITAVGRNGVVKQWSISGTLIDSFAATTNFEVISASFSDNGQIIAVTLADGSVAVGNISGTGWREWIVNKPLIRAVGASLDETDEVIESTYRRQDSYSFKGRKGQQIEISMESEEFSPSLILESQAGETIIRGGSSLTRILPEDGTYKIIATHSGDEVASGNYSLLVNERQYIEPPILQESAASLEEGDEIVSDKFRDVYRIEGQAGQEISISMESEDFDTFLSLEISAGETIAEDDDSGGERNSLLSVVLPETGTYKIIATTYGKGQSGTYLLEANETQLVEQPILQETAARLEEGDEIIQISSKRGDVYSFEGKKGQVITGRIKSEDSRASLELKDTEGENLELQNAEGETISRARSFFRTVLPKTGTYKALVTNSREENQAYNLLIHPRPARTVSVSSDGQRLATATPEGVIQLWDLQGNLIGTSSQRHQGEVLAVAFSPDGERIVSGGRDRTVRLWDSEGNPIGEPFQGHNGEVLSVAFSCDGERIVSGGRDGTLRIWNLEGTQLGEPLRGHGNQVLWVAFSHDNQRIVSGSEDNTLRIWEANVNNIFRGHEDTVEGVAFSPNGQLIASGGQDGTLRLWDLQGNLIREPFQGHEGAIVTVAFSPDGQLIASGGQDGTLRLWDLQGNLVGQPFQRHERYAWTVAFSPDGERILSVGGNILLRDLQGNPIGQTFQGHEDLVWGGAFSPNGKLIATGSSDRTVRLWDLQGNPVGQAFQGHEDEVWGIDFSPNGKLIATASADRTVRLWDLQGNPVGQAFQGHEEQVVTVAFSPDGQRIVSSSFDGTVRVWDLQGNPIGLPFQGHEDRVMRVAFSPDGERIVSSSYDRTVRLWWAFWEEWLENSCNRLQHHPILRNPDESLGEDFRKIASEVSTACDQRIWEKY